MTSAILIRNIGSLSIQVAAIIAAGGLTWRLSQIRHAGISLAFWRLLLLACLLLPAEIEWHTPWSDLQQRRDVMLTTRVKMMTTGVAACLMLSAPAIGSAQSSRYIAYEQPSVVVECGAGQRAVMTQRFVNGAPQTVARCEGVTTRAASRGSVARSVERPRRTKTKTALMIAGSTATGAGIGGATKGKKGAIAGAAIGGGAASIYEALKRR